MKILITGAEGFIGSHLTEALIAEGHDVRALFLYNSFNNRGWLEDINTSERLEIVAGDIRDPSFCIKLTEGIDIIFHLAALIAIPYSYIAPDSYIQTNVTGTLNLCQAAKINNCRRIIHTSTSEVYGTAQYVPIDEKHPKQPQSPYSASKIGADAIALSFFLAHGLPVTVARPFNTYGPRQSARAVIPTIITQIVSGQKIIKLGDITPTRDFNYVEDTCSGLMSLISTEKTIGKEINISSNTEYSIGQMLEIIKDLLNADVEYISEHQRIRPSNSEVYRLVGDNRLIQELTGYTPKFTLKEGLKRTIDWFLMPGVIQKYKADVYNV